MRFSLALVLAAACSVPDKQPVGSDGGIGDDGGGNVDPTIPETTIDEAPTEFSGAAQATFRFSSNVASATFVCRIDNETADACTSPYVRTLADGSHTFAVRAVSSSGKSDDTPAEHVWSIDTVAPDTMLMSAPPVADNSVMATFTFKSNEANVSFECSLDNAGFLPCHSGDAFGPVNDGPHTFSVRARDRAGNADAAPASYAWVVDTSTPDTQIASGPTGAVGTQTATFTFVSPDAGGGATFQCSLDGAAFAPCTSPKSYTGLSEGNHEFEVRVRDAVGNFDPTPASRAWRVDLTPPTTTIVSGPTGMVPMASATFTFTSNEQDVTFECSFDGVPATPCTSPVSATQLGQGSHTFTVRATDAAGHADPSPAMRNWAVDTIAPEISFSTGPASGTTSGPRVLFTFSVNEGNVACAFDAAAFAPCASPIGSNLPAGAHEFSVRATDGAGNVAIVTRSWSVACNAPDAMGAAGLLHLEEMDQSLGNGVAGGAAATLGDSAMVEVADPASTPGRFGNGLAFTSIENDRVAWPVALPMQPDLTLELWAKPDSVAGTHDLLVSSDGRVAIRVMAASPTTVRFIAMIDEGGNGQVRSVTSAPVAAGAWHHVMMSFQEPSMKLWVDGARLDANNVRPKDDIAFPALRLGGSGGGAYSGALDEVWLAQTAITNNEVALGRYCPL